MQHLLDRDYENFIMSAYLSLSLIWDFLKPQTLLPSEEVLWSIGVLSLFLEEVHVKEFLNSGVIAVGLWEGKWAVYWEVT